MQKPKDMPKTKYSYDVYDAETEEFIGKAVAVSEEQACNLVRFRNRNSAEPNGGYKEDHPMVAFLSRD